MINFCTKNITKFMKALFAKIETFFTRIAHKARRLISNGVLDVMDG